MNRLTTLRRSALAAATLAAMAPAWGQALDAATAVDVAHALLQPGQAAAQMANASPLDAFVARAEAPAQTDAVGETHTRFDRTHQGIPVHGGDVIVHFGKDGALTRVTQMLTAPLNLPSVTPSVDRAVAMNLAAERFRLEGKVRSSSAELIIETQAEMVGKPALVWLVKVKGTRCQQPSWMHYLIDAFNGKVRAQYEGQHSFAPIECRHDAPASPWEKDGVSIESAAVGTGNSLYYGTVSVNTDKIAPSQYDMKDTTRGSHYVSDWFFNLLKPLSDPDNIWGNGTTSDRATVAVDAAYGQAKTWDYYKAVHSRNGIANDGKGYSSTVHFQERGADVDNAYWDGAQMKYGDGKTLCKPLVSLDIAGHEMTHGVTSKTANLVYKGESGGLNEATSDIFGTMIEYRAADPNDPPDYLLGEKIVKAPGVTALRFMYQPSLDVGLWSQASRDCWATGYATVDPHFTSGVGNHFYYLLAEGSQTAGMPVSKVCKQTDSTNATDSIKVAGIGRANAEQLWYHALTNNMTSTTDYKAARVATLASAKSLYGDDSLRYRATEWAWLAVNVSDVAKVASNTNNLTKGYAQIVYPTPELVVMGRNGVSGKTHWYAIYLDAGKSGAVTLTAADATTNFDLIGYDTNGTTVLARSEAAAGAKETVTLTNSGTARKLVYVTVPYKSGDAPYSLRVKIS